MLEEAKDLFAADVECDGDCDCFDLFLGRSKSPVSSGDLGRVIPLCIISQLSQELEW